MKKTMLFLALIGLMAVWTGCAKEEGCTNRDAVNFNSDAEEDDGSCRYEASMVVYYDEATSDLLVDDGAVSLTYYLDGNIIGSGAASVFAIGDPNCGQDGFVSTTQSLGDRNEGTFRLEVIDQTGFVYWDLVVTIPANTCLQLELE